MLLKFLTRYFKCSVKDNFKLLTHRFFFSSLMSRLNDYLAFARDNA